MCPCDCQETTTNYFIQEARVGQPAPDFEMETLQPDGTFGSVSLSEQLEAGKWTVLYFYPLDFTFVCPTEIKAMSEAQDAFEERNTTVIAVSTDSVYSHLAWTKDPSLGPIQHVMAADTNHAVSKAYGVLIEEEGISLRGLFIIDPEGKLVHATINDNNVGRNVEEVLRLLEAFQSGGLAPCNWQPGEQLLDQ